MSLVDVSLAEGPGGGVRAVRASAAAAVRPGGVDWVGIYIGKRSRKSGRQSPNQPNKVPTKAC